jgi:hypothetical protein
MQLSPSTVSRIKELYREKVPTPEICTITGVSPETVLTILVEKCQTPTRLKRPTSLRKVGRAPIEWSSVITDITATLCREPHRNPLWTVDSLLDTLAYTSGRLIAKSTVLRKLRENGYSFENILRTLRFEDDDLRLAEAYALKKTKRGNLYALLEIKSGTYNFIEETVSGLVAIRTDNFAVCLFREQRNITPQFYKEFSLRLLNHHTGRHVIILHNLGSEARQNYLSSFAKYYRRLHLFSRYTDR